MICSSTLFTWPFSFYLDAESLNKKQWRERGDGKKHIVGVKWIWMSWSLLISGFFLEKYINNGLKCSVTFHFKRTSWDALQSLRVNKQIILHTSIWFTMCIKLLIWPAVNLMFYLSLIKSSALANPRISLSSRSTKHNTEHNLHISLPLVSFCCWLPAAI